MENEERPVVVPNRNNKEGSITKAVHVNAPASEDDTPIARAVRESLEMRRKAEEKEIDHLNQVHIVAVANQKGGVGKTTSVVNLAAALAQNGTKVLVIDSDPQGNASTALGIDHHPGTPSLYEVFAGENTLAEVLVESAEAPGLFVVPSTVNLAGIELELADDKDRAYRLKEALHEYLQEAEINLVFIDCPPSLGTLTVNAFAAAHSVLIPVQAEYYALEGISLLTDTVEKINSVLNPELDIIGYLITMFDKRTNLSRQVEADVRGHYPDQTLQALIPRQVSVSEAPSWQQTVITYDANSTGATAYRLAAGELLERLKAKED